MPQDYRGSTHAGQMLVEDVDKLTIMNNNVLIDPEWEEETSTGLVLPKDENDHLYGTVMGVGTKTKEGLKKGDKVIFQRYVGHTIVTTSGDMIMLPEDDIYAVLDFS